MVAEPQSLEEAQVEITFVASAVGVTNGSPVPDDLTDAPAIALALCIPGADPADGARTAA